MVFAFSASCLLLIDPPCNVHYCVVWCALSKGRSFAFTSARFRCRCFDPRHRPQPQPQSSVPLAAHRNVLQCVACWIRTAPQPPYNRAERSRHPVDNTPPFTIHVACDMAHPRSRSAPTYRANWLHAACLFVVVLLFVPCRIRIRTAFASYNATPHRRRDAALLLLLTRLCIVPLSPLVPSYDVRFSGFKARARGRRLAVGFWVDKRIGGKLRALASIALRGHFRSLPSFAWLGAM